MIQDISPLLCLVRMLSGHLTVLVASARLSLGGQREIVVAFRGRVDVVCMNTNGNTHRTCHALY